MPLAIDRRSSVSPRPDRPLNVMFLLTSMPVGGAETLLVNLLQRIDRRRFAPEVGCLKEPGELGQSLASELPVHGRLLAHKYDLGVVRRLSRLLRQRRIDALITVGAGDKMFWGRLAARSARIPVACALHSTGWPDGIGRLNRGLTRITNYFVAVAAEHGRYLVDVERLPAKKVVVIPNGVDVERFRPDAEARRSARPALGLNDQGPVLGIVAALRPEKHHRLLLEAVRRLVESFPKLQLLVVGEGPQRAAIEASVHALQLADHVRLLGNRRDVPQLLNALDLFALSSRMEANPVSLLEAQACGVPVVAPRVGSIAESVRHRETGLLYRAGDADELASHCHALLSRPGLARRLGRAGRANVERRWSLEVMVRGYERLLEAMCPWAARQPAAAAAQAAAQQAARPHPDLRLGPPVDTIQDSYR